MKKVLFCLVLLSITVPCQGGPILTDALTSYGGGIFGFDIGVFDPASESSDYAFSITFTGPILQTLASSSSAVDTDTEALHFNTVPAAHYSKSLDSWMYTGQFAPFPDSFANAQQTANSYTVNLWTGTGSQFTDMLFAHIAASGPISYQGTISRDGIDFPVSGVIAIPEPATWTMLVTAAVAGAAFLLSRRGKASPVRAATLPTWTRR